MPFWKYVRGRNAYEDISLGHEYKFQNQNLTGIKVHMYWIKKIWRIYTMDFYSGIKSNFFIFRKK